MERVALGCMDIDLGNAQVSFPGREVKLAVATRVKNEENKPSTC